jgi:hypothetical protein
LTSKPVCDFYIDDITLQRSIDKSTTSLTTSCIAERIAFGSNGRLAFATNDNIPFTVYNISGHKIMEGKTNNSNSIALPRGVYIVKIKNTTQKVIL